MSLSVHGFPDSTEAAGRLAAALGAPHAAIALHRFPDGESLVTAPVCAADAVLVRSLHDPNAKLVEILLAASALRDRGAKRVILVAPYLGYMRQDTAFAPGQAVSQKVVGRLLADAFDSVVTVAPHLHRVATLQQAVPAQRAIAVDPAPALARYLAGAGLPRNALVLGPDEESEPLARRLAEAAGLSHAVARKNRHGDRSVTVTLPADDLAGRPVIIADDVASSGGTLAACAAAAKARGAGRIEAIVCHALFGPDDAAMLGAAGISRVASCDSVPHPSNAIALAGLLADAVREAMR